jgi:protein-tyrosine phosphatase
VDGTYNFRDVGGVPTADGRLMRPGLIYRSASLDSVTPEGLAALVGLGIHTVVDIRSPEELERNGRFPHEGTGIAWFHVAATVGPPVIDDPEVAGIMASPDPMALMLPLLVRRSAETFAGAMRLAAESGRQPVVFHCTSGKDRTGLLALFIQLVVGVELETVLADFERSAEAMAAVRGDMESRYPQMAALPPETLDRLAAADRAWVLAALEAIGGLDNLEPWLDSIGVDGQVRHRLRRLLVE